MEKTKITALVLAASAAVMACDNPTQPSSVGGPTASVQSAVGGTQVVTGETGPNSLYALYRPDLWNGRLVLFAHGAPPPTLPVQLPSREVGPLRDALLTRGYAVAYSSYDEFGVAFKSGVLRTRQLVGLFRSEFGPPEHTYLIGQSMGGGIALMLAETNPGLFDGAVPMCAPLGGMQMAIDYFLNVRVLFDFYFPGVVPGDAMHVPDGVDFNRDVAPAVVNALISNPGRATELAGVDQVEIQYASFQELVTSIVSALGFHATFLEDVLGRTHNHSMFDNTATAYTGSQDDAALNAGVGRFSATPDATNFEAHYYQPDGKLTIPVLTLHTRRDPLIPFAHEAVYAGIVAAQGKSDLLVQRTFDRFGHCGFTVDERVRALEDLVAWAEHGVKPAQ